MVHISQFDPGVNLIHAILTADLTPEYLDTVQEKFAQGAWIQSPWPSEQLFIEKRLDLAGSSHVDMKRAYPDKTPLLVIDAKTPMDGAVWYIERSAKAEKDGEDAANANMLLKIRVEIESIVVARSTYRARRFHSVATLRNAGMPIKPVPEDFEQEKPYSIGSSMDTERYRMINTLVVAMPGEWEEQEPEPSRIPRYRLKRDIAQQHGLASTWGHGFSDAYTSDQKLTSGTLLKFPTGSKAFLCEWDQEETRCWQLHVDRVKRNYSER